MIINKVIGGGILLACMGNALALSINTTDGVINSTAGTASYGEVGQYVSGGNGLTGAGPSWPLDAGDGMGNVSQEASNIDHYWLQYDSLLPTDATSIIYSFNTATDSILAVSGIDHGPLPYEALEYIVWGWTGSSWEEGSITAIFDLGVDAGWDFDDYSSVWSFSNAYTRFAVSGGTHMVGQSGAEGEIDGIASFRQNSVPEPSAMLLMLAGLFGIRLMRRNRVS